MNIYNCEKTVYKEYQFHPMKKNKEAYCNKNIKPFKNNFYNNNIHKNNSINALKKIWNCICS